MIKRLFKNSFFWLFVIFLISFILYYPSLFVFYTNDDFFLLKIARISKFVEFLGFFNLLRGPEGLGMYRPLTTQVFYSLAWRFNLNPIPLHIISFITFFLVIYLVYFLTKEITKSNKASIISAFLYATSATHFGHLYYLGAYQELGVTLFLLISIILFIKFIKEKKLISYLLSFAAFILSLLSKETAVVLPFILIFTNLFLVFSRYISLSFRRLAVLLLPYFLVLLVYFYFRFFHYGFATGDSYLWSFSPVKMLNTLLWYSLWSYNLPEMLVDFVGPGIKFNLNLLKFWSREIIPIFILFVFQLGLTLGLIIKKYKLRNLKTSRNSSFVALFSLSWFVIALVPVLFLPIHKFTFYLTLPLIGVVIFISYLFVNLKVSNIWISIFIGAWVLCSFLALSLTKETHWITQGEATARTAYNYFQDNRKILEGKTVLFYDTEEDKDLPWSPTLVLRTTLSDKNFFEVYYNNRIKPLYNQLDEPWIIKIESRQFLGY